MSESELFTLLDPIAETVRRHRFWREVAVRSLVAAAAALLLSGWQWRGVSTLLYAALGVSLFLLWLRRKKLAPTPRELARLIEHENPSLASKLLAAVEQTPDPETGRLNFLQERLLQEAVAEHERQGWGQRFLERLFFLQCGALMTLMLSLGMIGTLRTKSGESSLLASLKGVEVSPGDTQLESGSSLVVFARFHTDVPNEAVLVIEPKSGTVQRLPLIRNLKDPVMGGSVPEVRQELSYHIEYGTTRTPSYKVTVYEHPALVRSDADLKYPAYTGLAPRTIEQTRRVTAVEGSELRWRLQLNKPVQGGRMFAKSGESLNLVATGTHSNEYTATVTLSQSAHYELQLKDSEGRTNKDVTEFVVEVLKNRTPEIKLVTPKGDQRVSPLAEMYFAGQVVDDFGVRAYGLAYTPPDKPTVFVPLGEGAGANEKRSFEYLLPLEKLGSQPEQLVSYYLWADDIGADGQVRRTATDIYFAEIRPFEEVYREAKEADGEESQKQPGNKRQQLAKLQRQIVTATWKLQRRETGAKPSAKYHDDVDVVQQSQVEALQQLKALQEKADDERTKALLQAAGDSMEKAGKHLAEAAGQNTVPPLGPALAAEQSAANALLKLQAREHRISRSQGQGSGESDEEQRRLAQLDLKQKDKAYQREKTATAPQSPEQKEQLQVLNRLKELAQRQQDVNERVKELQTALQEAKTDQEREQIQRQLKRLQEEQQQLLADLDELKQRMERPENQSSMAEARKQLEQTRSQMQRAAEQLERGATTQAAAAGSKAERELQQMRDEFRKKTSSQFAEAARDLRNQARELAQNQEEIDRQLQAPAQRQARTLSDTEDQTKLTAALNEQQKRMEELVKQATEVTKQSEMAEPLLSKQLYDTIRRTSQSEGLALRDTADELMKAGRLTKGANNVLNQAKEKGGNRTLEASADLLKNNYTSEARTLEQKARKNVEELKQGVEQAAGSVLGDDVEALRFAQREAEDLAKQAEQEANAGQDKANGAAEAKPQQAQGQAQNGKGKEPGQNGNGKSGQPGKMAGTDAGKNGESGKASAGQGKSGQGKAPSQTAENGTGGRPSLANGGGNGGGGLDTGGLFDSGMNGGPLTGGRYTQWTDRLRNLEETVDVPELRDELARVRQAARTMRTEFKRTGGAPKKDIVEAQITRPLAQVRDRLKEELARRESREALVPADRDPVPQKYSELVRRYYEKLGGNE